MIRVRITAAFGISLLVLFVHDEAAQADKLSFTCDDRDAGVPGEMTVAYEGGPSGVLTLKASFGEIELPATMEAREREVEGIQLKATGIRAIGPATVINARPCHYRSAHLGQDKAGTDRR